VRGPLKWKNSPPTPTPTKQRRLDDLFAGSTMPRKTTKTKIKSQVDNNTGLNRRHNFIETVTPISESKPEDKGIKSSSSKRSLNRPELELSPCRRSPRIQAQKSRLIPKYPLPLIESPPLPVRPESRPIAALPPPSPIFTPSLSINTRENRYSQNRSTTEPTPSYHTAFSSPINTSQNSTESVMDTREDSNASENERLITHKEIPCSIPWENTPSDGIGDAWPSSQSDSSPTKKSYSKSSQHSQPRYDDGFRVPDPPSSRISLDSTQDESQPSLCQSFPNAHLPPCQNNAFRTPDRLNWTHPGLADTQDESQPDAHQLSPSTAHNAFRVFRTSSLSKFNLDDTQDLTEVESEHEIPSTKRKRKREPTITEIPDSAPLDDTLQSPKWTGFAQPPLGNSLEILSQVPFPMRKKTPEIINIHSTQSQSQEWIPAPGPRPTSQDLSKPFGRNDSGDSSASSTNQLSHKWESSQVTQSPVTSTVELSLVANPPSQLLLSSQNDLSKTPVPLAMTLAYKFPQKTLGLPDLDKMEKEQELNLQKWETEKYTPKTRRK
jgi:hypothetical protein